MELSNNTTKLINCVFGEYSRLTTMFKLETPRLTMFKLETIVRELTKSLAVKLYPKPYNNFSEAELKEALIELKKYYFFRQKSLKISRDDFEEMEDWEKAKFINKIYFEYTQTKCIYIYRGNDNCFYDIDSESIIDNLYDYALALNNEYTDVYNRLFK